MGPGISKVPGSFYIKKDAFVPYSEDIFKTASDEIAFSKEFNSSLISKKKNDVVKPLILPDYNLIVDIVSNPLAFTQFSTPTQCWQQIISQLFTVSQQSMSQDHQILEEYYKFIKQRPDGISLIENQSKKRLEMKRQKENQAIFEALNNKNEKSTIDIDSLLKIVQQVDVFIKKLRSYESKKDK